MNRMFAAAIALLLCLAAAPTMATPPAPTPADATADQDPDLDFDRPIRVQVEFKLADGASAPPALSSYLDAEGFQLRLDVTEHHQHQDGGTSQQVSARLLASREGAVISRQQLEALVAQVERLAAPLHAPQWTLIQTMPFPGGHATRSVRFGAPR